MASSPRQEQNLEFATRAFDAWIGGDREGALGMFHEDIEVFVPAELANAGTYRGLEQFLKWIVEWDQAWSSFEMSVEEMAPLGERHVVSRVKQRAKGAMTGIPVEMDVGWLTEVRDGKIAALHLYPDTAEARRVAEEREAAG